MNSSGDNFFFRRIVVHFKTKTDHRRGQYNGCKIGVACVIGSRVFKTSDEITEVQLKKQYLMKSVMLTHSILMFCIIIMVFVLRPVSTIALLYLT